MRSNVTRWVMRLNVAPAFRVANQTRGVLSFPFRCFALTFVLYEPVISQVTGLSPVPDSYRPLRGRHSRDVLWLPSTSLRSFRLTSDVRLTSGFLLLSWQLVLAADRSTEPPCLV